jgi:hypothetical protein
MAGIDHPKVFSLIGKILGNGPLIRQQRKEQGNRKTNFSHCGQ